jgi:hypothetical protein
MAHNALVRAGLAAWEADPIVVALEFRKLDLACYESINGDQGGTWAPATVITIGGSGQTVTGQFRATDVRNMVVNALGAFACNADAEFNGLLEITGTGNLQVAIGSTANFDGDVSIGGEVDILDKFRINSGANFTVESGATFNLDVGSTVNIGASLTITNAFIRSGSNARDRTSGRIKLASNTDELAGVEYDYIEMNISGAVLKTLTLKIATAPVPTQNEKIFVRKIGAGAGGLVIQNEGSAANLATVGGANTANFILMFEATTAKWRVFSAIGTYSLGADAV